MKSQLLYSHLLLLAVASSASFVDVPVYVNMTLSTLIIIYIGSLRSVSSAAGSSSSSSTENKVEWATNTEGSSVKKQQETMASSDAYMFPVIGSVVLFSLYLCYKFLPKDYLNFVVKVYFSAVGSIVLGLRISVFLQLVLPSSILAILNVRNEFLTRLHIRFLAPKTTAPIDASTDNTYNIAYVDVIGFSLAALNTVLYLTTNHWLTNNAFGIAFSLQAIESLALGSFQHGAILLVGLFFYDIFWVFGTDVMVTVAKSFDGPIKLLFPREAGSPHSLLGLGDIVIPGIFIALMLRYDYSKVDAKSLNEAASKGETVKTSTPYFYAQLFMYFVGLSTTCFIMFYFKHAQPALLYLVPAALIGSIGLAAYKGQISTLWSFKETHEEAKEEDKKD